MDKLTKKIAATRQALHEAEDQLTRHEAAMRAAAEKYHEGEKYLAGLKIELQALEEADRLRPTADTEDGMEDFRPAKKKRGGRQPGSISIKWRQALSDLVSAGNQPLDQPTFYLLTRGRLGLAEASIRERLRQYVGQGILIETGGRYTVSEFAIDRWHLSSDRDASGINGQSEKNAAPH